MNNEKIKRTIRIIKRKKAPIIVAVILAVIIAITPIIISAYSNYQRFAVKNPIELSSVFVKNTDREKITLISDKGLYCQAPENTIPAVELCSQYGYSIVKIDIKTTVDGVWVALSDNKLSAMTDGNGKLSSQTYYDIMAFNIVKGANHSKYDELKIASLDHILKSCLEHNLVPVLSVEECTEDEITTLLTEIDKNGFTETCSIISKSRDVLNSIHKLNEKISLYKIADSLTKKEIKSAISEPEIGLVINADKKINTETKIKKLLGANIKIICQVGDNTQNMQKFYGYGVTDFLTSRICNK